MSEYQYYTLPEGCATLQATLEFMKEATVKQQMQFAFAKQLGASSILRGGGRFLGIIFKHMGAPPEGFRHYKGDELTTYRPDRRTPKGKEYMQNMQVLYVDGTREYTEQVLKGDRVMTGEHAYRGFYFAYGCAEKIDSEAGPIYVIGIPLDAKGKPGFKAPKDAVPIKMSEYHKLKEAALEIATRMKPKAKRNKNASARKYR